MAIQLSDSIFVGQQKPVEDKYYNGLSPYTNTAQVNSTLASAIRYRGLTVNVAGAEYWYKDGIADGDLVVKSGGGGSIGVQDQGVTVESDTRFINFTGNGVTATSVSSGLVQVDIPGGLSTPYHSINLSSGNYTITDVGQYEIINGASSTNKIIFPNPTSVNNGDKITIVNRDLTNFYKAPLDDTYLIFFQGGLDIVHDQGGALDVFAKVSNIPSGMTYVFEAVRNGGNSFWMCHPMNIEPYYDNIILYNTTTGGEYPLYIQNYGIYNIVKGSAGAKDATIHFPNPIHHVGKKVTLLVTDTCLLDRDDGIDVYNGIPMAYSSPMTELNGGGIYTFIATPECWMCISANPPIDRIIVLDLSPFSVNYPLSNGGIYSITAAGSYGLNFENPVIGTRIVIINKTSSNISFYGNDIRYKNNITYSGIPAYATVEITCDNIGYRLLYEY